MFCWGNEELLDCWSGGSSKKGRLMSEEFHTKRLIEYDKNR
jgi:hypothetical protein